MEIEAKFRIPDEQTLQSLLETSVLAGFTVGEATVANLHDRYLDTKDKSIRSQGYACRLRQFGGRYLATLKGLGGASGAVHRRVEHEVKLPEPLPPQAWPSSTARDLILRFCGQEPLSVLFDIKQTRHSRPLRKGGRVLAELSLDRGRIYHKGAVMANYLELEAELLADGREEDLARLGTVLQRKWGLAPEGRSKYDRAMALVGLRTTSSEGSESNQGGDPTPMERERGTSGLPAPPGLVELLDQPDIKPDDPMSEAGRKTFRFHYQRMVYNEPGTRLGDDIEALHDMRVATRRMRAAFRVFGAYYEPKAIKSYLKGLKRTGRALGAVRDLDVFRAKIHTYLEGLPASEQGSLDDLLVALEAEREAARERMNAYLDEKKYQRFVAQFGAFVETEGTGSLPVAPNGEDPRPYRVRHVAPVTVYRRLAAVRAYDEWVCLPDPPLARLHALRIACKRLRYTMEFFQEVLGPDTKALIKEVVALQDHLGALQDAVVASAILRDYLARGTWGQGAAAQRPAGGEAIDARPAAPAQTGQPGVAAYLASRESELQRLLDTFPEAWERLNRSEFTRMVAEAVMVL